MRPGLLTRFKMAKPVTDLPAPDSPTMPESFSPGEAEGDPVDRGQMLAAKGEGHGEVFDFEQGFHGFHPLYSLGLRKSRSQSPKRFMATIKDHEQNPGKQGDPPLARQEELEAGFDERTQ